MEENSQRINFEQRSRTNAASVKAGDYIKIVGTWMRRPLLVDEVLFIEDGVEITIVPSTLNGVIPGRDDREFGIIVALNSDHPVSTFRRFRYTGFGTMDRHYLD